MPKMQKQSVVETFKSKFPHDENGPENNVPRMVLNITELSNRDLGNFMSRYSAWREYTESLLTIAVAEFVIAREDYHRLVVMKKFSGDYDSYAGKKLSIKDKEAYIETDPMVQKNFDLLVEKEVYKDMLSSRLESFTNAITTISREITRRQNTV